MCSPPRSWGMPAAASSWGLAISAAAAGLAVDLLGGISRDVDAQELECGDHLHTFFAGDRGAWSFLLFLKSVVSPTVLFHSKVICRPPGGQFFHLVPVCCLIDQRWAQQTWWWCPLGGTECVNDMWFRTRPWGACADFEGYLWEGPLCRSDRSLTNMSGMMMWNAKL